MTLLKKADLLSDKLTEKDITLIYNYSMMVFFLNQS